MVTCRLVIELASITPPKWASPCRRLTAEFWQLEPAWIARLSDPDDEPILQMAAEAKVPIIVTRNIRHLKPAESFGIEAVTPVEFLAKLRTNI